jgi:hypothetical protein
MLRGSYCLWVLRLKLLRKMKKRGCTSAALKLTLTQKTGQLKRKSFLRLLSRKKEEIVYTLEVMSPALSTTSTTAPQRQQPPLFTPQPPCSSRIP